MKAHLALVDELRSRARADDAPEIQFDAGPPERRSAPSPMQGVLLAAMACTASDVVEILRKQRVAFESFEIDAEAQRAADHPKVFTKIHLHFRIRGRGIPDAAVKRAIDLSTEKYCSVGIMLRRAGVQFVNTHEILPME